jgi:RNase P subunit RPR2
MARYAICSNCDRLYRYEPVTTMEYGNTITTVKCEHCGFEVKTTRSHMHEGSDSLGK